MNAKQTSAVIATTLVAVVTLGLGIPAGASVQDEVWTDVDAGSLGVTPAVTPSTWCLADAGSLGLLAPLDACARQ